MGGFCSGYAGSAQLKYVLFIKNVQYVILIKPCNAAVLCDPEPCGSRADQNAYGPTIMVSRSTELER